MASMPNETAPLAGVASRLRCFDAGKKKGGSQTWFRMPLKRSWILHMYIREGPDVGHKSPSVGDLVPPPRFPPPFPSYGFGSAPVPTAARSPSHWRPFLLCQPPRARRPEERVSPRMPHGRATRHGDPGWVSGQPGSRDTCAYAHAYPHTYVRRCGVECDRIRFPLVSLCL